MVFIKENNIDYIVSGSTLIIDGKKIEDTRMVSLVREFKPQNKRIYRAVFSDVSLYLYKVN